MLTDASPDQLVDVRLVCDDVLAVQQQPNNRRVGAPQGTLALVPGVTQSGGTAYRPVVEGKQR